MLDDADLDYGSALAGDPAFARWVERNVQAHKVPGYAAVVLSTKPGPALPPGDVTAEQMEGIAELAERYGFGEIRIAHEQNLVLPDVRKADLYAVWQRASELGLATPNIGLLTDIIACPGGDYCSLANAKSIPIAQAIQERFADLDHLHDLGELSLNISGCMNACAHHHIGNIGILGVDKNGSEWYQVDHRRRPGQGQRAGQGDRPGVRRRADSRGDRAAGRHLRRLPRGRRALRRHRAAHRPGAVQGARVPPDGGSA